MEMLGRGTLGHERQAVEKVGNQKSRKVEELIKSVALEIRGQGHHRSPHHKAD